MYQEMSALKNKALKVQQYCVQTKPTTSMIKQQNV